MATLTLAGGVLAALALPRQAGSQTVSAPVTPADDLTTTSVPESSTTSAPPAPTTSTSARGVGHCPPPAPPVTILVDDSVDPTVLPAGFTLAQGSPTDLNRFPGGPTYEPHTDQPPGPGPSLGLSRTLADTLPAGASGDTTTTINGHPAHVYYHGFGHNSSLVDVAWQQTRNVVLRVAGMEEEEEEVLAVARGVHYTAGHERQLSDADLPAFLSRQQVIDQVRRGVQGTITAVGAKEMFVADFEQAQSTFGGGDFGEPDQDVWLAWVSGPDLSFPHSEPPGPPNGAAPDATTVAPRPWTYVFGVFTESPPGEGESGGGPGSLPAAFSSLPDREPCPS